MASDPNLFSSKFKELAKLYSDVKGKIILAEQIYDEFPVTLTNEVRNSYDHVCRIFANGKEDDKDEVEKQFVSASRHLKRAGYDACELIVGGYFVKMNEIMNRYSFEQLNCVFSSPSYAEIKIQIDRINTTYLVKARNNKNLQLETEDDDEIDALYLEFASIIENVQSLWETVTNHQSLLEQNKKESITKSRYKILLNICVGAFLLLVGWAIEYFKILERILGLFS